MTYILFIYDYFKKHRLQRTLLLCIVTALLSALILRLHFQEDISAFLPLDEQHKEALQVYQDVSGANRLLAIFQSRDTTATNPDETIAAIETFAEQLAQADTTHYISDITTQVDLEQISELTDFVYTNIPYFLTDNDYLRMDSLLNDAAIIDTRLEEAKQMLMFPSSGLLATNLARDPLNIFTPVVAQLQPTNGGTFYERYDGYIFTKDMQRGMAVMTSPFGNSETQNNGKLMAMLESIADSVEATHPTITLHYIGGPAIAVGNATQIKKDSILSIAIAVVLILLLLIATFRSFRNILLIVVSITWGWLFALGCLSLVHNNISLIVVGISSIILGIVVNYPLHLIAHCDHTVNTRQALKEVVAPLIIGNITTVGAFMALVPLKATALRDLGLFSAFLLIGTIFFVVIFLPHAVKKVDNTHTHQHRWLERISNITLENKRWLVWTIVLLTAVFGWFSFDTSFDANMSHINYMTQEQRDDMEYLQQITSGTSTKQEFVYVVTQDTTIDAALSKHRKIHQQIDSIAQHINGATLSSCSRFFCSQDEQAQRLERWQTFVDQHRETLTTTLQQKATAHGFKPEAFDTFYNTIGTTYTPHDFSYFKPLLNIYANNFSIDTDNKIYRVVEAVTVDIDKIASTKQQLENIEGKQLVFDVPSMNSALANNLSNDFNYIGWACCLIVFIFLWFSFGNIELALLSFLPMAVSWVWILGIMGITGMQFNIVNIILATFIFGQGDDYTIFMTEGCCYEYAYRRRMVASYKSSIIISALIMFIGIGTLIFAKHPALHSLAELIIVGMFSVVLMAYVLPPLVFRWIVSKRGNYRLRPLTLATLLRTALAYSIGGLTLLAGETANAFMALSRRKNDTRNTWRNHYAARCLNSIAKWLPGVSLRTHDNNSDTAKQPCIIVGIQQSPIDMLVLTATQQKLCFVVNQQNTSKLATKWLNIYTIDNHFETNDFEALSQQIAKGYQLVVLADAEQFDSAVATATTLANTLKLAIMPVALHGTNYVTSTKNGACYNGIIDVAFGLPETNDNTQLADTTTKTQQLQATLNHLNQPYDDTTHHLAFAIDRYRYKGVDVMREVKKTLRQTNKFALLIEHEVNTDAISIEHAGYGIATLLFALTHPQVQVYAFEDDPDKAQLATIAAQDVANNLHYNTTADTHTEQTTTTLDLNDFTQHSN